MQATHRFLCPLFLHQEGQRAIRGSQTKDAYVHIGDRRKYTAGHFRLAAKVLADYAHQSFVVFPSEVRDTAKFAATFGRAARDATTKDKRPGEAAIKSTGH